MDILTYANLVPVDQGEHSHSDLDVEAVSYIRSLVAPIAQELTEIFTSDTLKVWAHMALPRDLVADWTTHTYPCVVADKKCWIRDSTLEADKTRFIYLLGLYLVTAARDYMEMESIHGPINPIHVAAGARRYTFSFDPCLAYYFKFDGAQ